MLPAARVTDQTGHPGGTVAGPGSANVLIEGLPAAVAGMTQHVCGMPPPAGPHPPTPFTGTSATVLINGRPALRQSDLAGCGAPIITGAKKVFIL